MRRKENNRSKRFMVYFMAIVMISSVFAVMFYGFAGGNRNCITYDEFKICGEGELWVINVNQNLVYFDYLPTGVLDIEVSSEIFDSMRNTVEVDMTYDLNASFSDTMGTIGDTMMMEFNNIFSVYLRLGITSENDLGYDIITCSSATAMVPVLYFKESNETEVYTEDNCIIAEAKNGIEALRIRDRIMYGLLGIIE